MRVAIHLFTLLALIQQVSVRVDVNLQQVRFAARDGGGASVVTLAAQDVIVEENGVPQKITRIARESDSPVSFVLLLHAGLDWRPARCEAAITIGREIIRQMKPEDEIAMVTPFEGPPALALQAVNNQTEEIDKALTRAFDNSIGRQDFLKPGVALPRALETVKSSKHRARALIVITRAHWDLGRTLSADGLDKAVGNQREIPIYFFDVGGAVDGSSVTGVGRTALPQFGFAAERNVEFWQNPFTEATGGHAFHFDFNSRTSAKAMSHLSAFVQQMDLDLRTNYVLEYYSSVPASSARRIRIRHVSPDYRFVVSGTPLQRVDSGPLSQLRSSISSSRSGSTSVSSDHGRADFVRVQPGEFLMGCAQDDLACYPVDPDPQNVGGIVLPNARRLNPWRVRIRKAFEIGKYEVTQAQWEHVMGGNPSYFRGADRPVENVSWNDIQEFLKRLNARKDGHRYRLPSEEEWEYVARAGEGGPYEASLDLVAWYRENSDRQTHPVGKKSPSAWGVHDIYGNVFEWTADAMDDQAPDFGRYGAKRFRGGSWLSTSLFSRTSFRMGLQPDSRLSTLGFRLVREED